MNTSSTSLNNMIKEEKLPLIFISIIFGIILLKTAWISDDAFITFRTVDNFINGYGLRWNIVERVQVYTHPLWMFIVSFFYFFTNEIYYTTIFISIVVSLIGMYVFIRKVSLSYKLSFAGIIIFTCSKAFTDYSTSGLENPLTHLLLFIFFGIYFSKDPMDDKKITMLSWCSSLSMVNRMDSILFYFPILTYILWQQRSKKCIMMMAAGFLPFILWELFSLIYYGFLFPNTAFAKLNTGIASIELFMQGLLYVLNSITNDPISLSVITFAIIVAFLSKKVEFLLPASGMLLYLLYTIKIGGDFMSGRFFTAPLVVAVIILSRCKSFENKSYMLSFIFVGLSILSPYSPLLSGADYGLDHTDVIDKRGIADERRAYYNQTGLLLAGRNIQMPMAAGIPTEEYIKQIRSQSMYAATAAGLFGFWAGPKVHIIDKYALTEPLLARLPIIKHDDELDKFTPGLSAQHWRIGHFRRKFPNGYISTISSGKNKLKDKDLARLYDKLILITKGNLFDGDRLKEIFKFNTGQYENLIDFENYDDRFEK